MSEPVEKFVGRRYSDAEKALLCVEICARLAAGDAMAAICREPDMPDPVSVGMWAERDAELAQAIALARRVGHDAIANRARMTLRGFGPEFGGESTGDVHRDKAIADFDLKLLAKWDPKRYGEAMQMRLADADGQKLDTAPMVRELMALMRPSDGSDAQVIEGSATAVAPAAKSPPAGR